MSARISCGAIRARIKISQSNGWSGAPINMQSLTLLVFGVGFALASNTILTFVLVA